VKIGLQIIEADVAHDPGEIKHTAHATMDFSMSVETRGACSVPTVQAPHRRRADRGGRR